MLRHEIQGRREPAAGGLRSAEPRRIRCGERRGAGLNGADDARIYKRSQDEGRAFITLDVDLANVHACQPRSSAGVVVLWLRRQDKLAALDAVARMLPLLQQEPLRRRLWIIEAAGIRIRE